VQKIGAVKMFFNILLNKSHGVTAEELLHYLEHVVAYGGRNNIVYASSKPITMISCEPTCVLMGVE
jgi:alkylhydroperoxidase/carboxymuconolactone decarboxylase family protein YurZ